MKRRLSILGVTGSVGRSTMAVIEELRAQGGDISVEAITAGGNIAALAAAARTLQPAFVAVADPNLLDAARAALPGIAVGAGESALAEAAARPADWVMSAIVGAAGLKPTLAAVRRGAAVALANKECLVCAGPLLRAEADRAGAVLLPVDSEHNAVFQVLTHPEAVERITLTASGGPFRTWTSEAMEAATPDQACAHPNWAMGAKISVDSATLMNKGLELIEAHYLFGLPPAQIAVLVHPQSVIHSLVHYADGSVLAQLGAPDMRIPISYTLAWPKRMKTSAARLDLAELGRLTFEPPDEGRFPALGYARAAAEAGPRATAALNAANEVAVGEFLAGRLGFSHIAPLAGEILDGLESSELRHFQKTPSSFDEVEAIDQTARAVARRVAVAHINA
ncbi:MAG: 1-deoxy-D-xylulose-5-phosphate reductoisomerase [Alphaproteobacteria bacterium]|nr:1-deoxy-D-xylulose-5-phosphate reductoisomerase [Alphaproteobacteria bacterium]